MSDPEWFTSLSQANHKADDEKSHNIAQTSSHRRSRSSISKPVASLPSADTRSRNSTLARDDSVPTTSTSTSTSRLGLPRSISGQSIATGPSLRADEVAKETQSRRKRDRILRHISGRRGQAPKNSTRDDLAMGIDGAADGKERVQTSQAGLHGLHEGHVEDEMDEDDPEAGQYVNFQVGFEYKRSESAKRKGWGLHMLVSWFPARMAHTVCVL
jgi:hypothetical protein